MKIIKPGNSGFPIRYPIAPFLMRLSAIFILSTAFMVHGFAGDLSAQQITLNKVKADFESIIEEIRQQTGYDFMVKKEVVQQTKPFTIHVLEASLEAVLKQVVAHQNLTFKILDDIKMVIISERPFAATSSTSENERIRAYQQTTGRVVDSTGTPLSGASIRVLNAEGKRTTLQTQTGRNGEFTLRDVPQHASLEISYIGYITQIIVASPNVGVIVLKALPSALDEVEVNAGYYTVKEREKTVT